MDWLDIEREAKDQVTDELKRLEETPLVFGDPIAWAEYRYARTDGLSEVHHVGVPKGKDGSEPYTTCEIPIPPPIAWLPLSPAMIRTMPRCRYCHIEHARVAREQAA